MNRVIKKSFFSKISLALFAATWLPVLATAQDITGNATIAISSIQPTAALAASGIDKGAVLRKPQ